MDSKITHLLNIKYPIIQGGMVWTSGWKLASAVSNAGGLGVIGAGSMNSEVLEIHLQKMQQNCTKPFAVNLPLLYSKIEEQIDLIITYKVPVVITSAGSPAKFTETLKSAGIKVIHVVSSSKFAMKAELAGVDAVVAEGFEAGGHNGREETTTMCLIPKVVDSVNIPVIAAGGISDGRGMAAAFALGAQGVQLGTRFALTPEASSSTEYKLKGIMAQEGATKLTLKELAPVRLLLGPFSEEIDKLYAQGGTVDQLRNLLGKGRSKKGIFEGDFTEGEMEIGQVCANINELIPAAEVVQNLVKEYHEVIRNFKSLD
ncbi:MAG: enoyl-[acyl-carrier protein] reductase II [Luteibaculaceae bacterium]|jgi:enoyl-[acyl-carrier protein] reductase II